MPPETRPETFTLEGRLYLRTHRTPLDRAPRCGAKTRSGRPCLSPAMELGRCRMHGGSTPVKPSVRKAKRALQSAAARHAHDTGTLDHVADALAVLRGLIIGRLDAAVSTDTDASAVTLETLRLVARSLDEVARTAVRYGVQPRAPDQSASIEQDQEALRTSLLEKFNRLSASQPVPDQIIADPTGAASNDTRSP
jgi:hypothetical protein